MAKKKTIEDMKKEQRDALTKYKQAEAAGDTSTMMFQKDRYDSLQNQIEKTEIYEKMTPEQRQAAKDKPITAKDVIGGLTSGIKATAEGFKSSIKDDPEAYEKQKQEYEAIWGSGAAPIEETPTETTEEIIEETPAPVETPATPTEEAPAPEVTTPSSYDWRRSGENLKTYSNALLDTIRAGHARKANQAVALSGFAGQYGSTQKPFTEEETQSPFEKMREQSYQNYISNMQAEQQALNDVTRTDVKNKYKSVYDIDATNTTERQKYITQSLGEIQNLLSVDLNKSIMQMKKGELDSFIKEVNTKIKDIGDVIKDKSLVEGLKAALPKLLELSYAGKLEQSLLGTGSLDVVGGGVNAATTAGGLLASIIGKGL